jgi:2-dehydro-3-deoxyphosphooctonate aldolase (KDO 8-P synthase)
MTPVTIGKLSVGKGQRPVLIAGPCVIETYDILVETAKQAKALANRFGFSYILKSSFEKANRTSRDSYRGPGLEAGLELLARVKREIGAPILTDVHGPEQALPAAQVVDCLQIPAFLSRQTELIEAAARTGLPINIKKGQFLAPAAMRWAIEKARGAGPGGVLLTERGTFFGYGDLVVDMRSLLQMRELGVPVIFDATHSAQMPAGGPTTGGQRRYVAPLAWAAAATDAIDGIFLEVHPHPDQARSDASTQLPINQLEKLLERLRRIFDAAASS